MAGLFHMSSAFKYGGGFLTAGFRLAAWSYVGTPNSDGESVCQCWSSGKFRLHECEAPSKEIPVGLTCPWNSGCRMLRIFSTILLDVLLHQLVDLRRGVPQVPA
jgi:hypothetical protein